MPVNKHNAYYLDNVTAKKDKDRSITIHFGGYPKAETFRPIVPGWNYIVRLYRPKKEILDGSWTFPDPQDVVDGCCLANQHRQWPSCTGDSRQCS